MQSVTLKASTEFQLAITPEVGRLSGPGLCESNSIANGTRRAHNHNRFPSHQIFPHSRSIHYSTYCPLLADNRMRDAYIYYLPGFPPFETPWSTRIL